MRAETSAWTRYAEAVFMVLKAAQAAETPA
jgi:hypothetical protein